MCESRIIIPDRVLKVAAAIDKSIFVLFILPFRPIHALSVKKLKIK